MSPAGAAPYGSRPRARGRAAALLAFALGLALIALALPRAIAGFAILPGEPVLEQVQRGAAVESEALDTLIDSRRRALSWAADGGLSADLGLAWLLRADSDGAAGPSRREALQRAREALVEGLARRPMQSAAWLRLAATDLALGDPAGAAEALALSIRTGSYQPLHFVSRIRLGVRLWPFLDDDQRELIAWQVRMLWRDSPKRTVALARRLDAADLFAAALAFVPGAPADFRTRLGGS